jgi:tetratricopeptide (TPR) repeat protein
MKKICLIASLLMFLAPGLCLAADNTQRMLAINRSLLVKTEAEYQRLQKQDSLEPSEELVRRLSDLRYKMEALQDDSVRLRSELPKPLKASEFLKDLLVRRDVTGTPVGTINVQKEKILSERLDQVYERHEKALAYVAGDRLVEACRLYEEILLLSPDDGEAYLLLGHCRLLLKDYDKAKNAFLNAVNIDPNNAKEITRLYENVLVENPQDDAAYTHLGLVNWILGHQAEALECFRQALMINPDNVEAAAALAGAPASGQ